MRQRDIFWFWLPLFASWILMTAEGPFVSAVINRMPNEVVMLAAQGLVVSIAVTIESPIINLLSTSTALVKDRASYLLVRRFTIHLSIVLTVVSFLLAFTPLFELVVIDLIGTPLPVARWVKPGLQIMVFWTAAIAWRRFLQGVLIHYGLTRRVAWGTAVRLVASVGTAAILALYSDWPGVYIGATSLMIGVIFEAAYATIAVRPILNNQLSPNSPTTEGSPLTYNRLFWFHLPLAMTSFLALMAQPLVNFTLTRLEYPTLSLAAWPVLFQIMLIARAAAFAWPEAVIALSNGRKTFLPIRKFTTNTSVLLIGAMLLFILTPISTFYIFRIQDMEQVVGKLVQNNLIYFVFFPTLAMITSWLRGLLIKKSKTRSVNVGMAINILVTTTVLLIGLNLQLPGLTTAAIALNLASLFEAVYLTWRTARLLAPEIRLLHPRPIQTA